MTRPPKKAGRKPKPTVILFDEARRTEYLTGFHKRKVERRKLALKRAADELKEEKRRLKERHEALVLERATALAPELRLVQAGQPISEDLPEHTVTITELELRPEPAVAAPSAPALEPPPPISKKTFNKRLKDDLKMKPSQRKFQRKARKKRTKKRKQKTNR